MGPGGAAPGRGQGRGGRAAGAGPGPRSGSVSEGRGAGSSSRSSRSSCGGCRAAALRVQPLLVNVLPWPGDLAGIPDVEAAMKAEGIEYDERMAELVACPQPRAPLPVQQAPSDRRVVVG